MTRKHRGSRRCDVVVDFCDVFAHLILFSILTWGVNLPGHLFTLHLGDSLFLFPLFTSL